ncbi:manganese transporter [Longibacter salinarum]|uniref:Manganese transporter n=1 Tax=Longibacter salinarum TaxID=1850348 RepID=A0A2A8D181_9BACT|nr:manganese transporter [Longibacter salinarum]
MIDAFQLAFMQRAMIASVLIGALASYFGVFVVQRRLSFLGVGLSHAAFGGVALGLLLQVDPMWVALPFTVVVALGINVVTQRGDIAGDTAIGIFFAVAIALGVVFLALTPRYTSDAFAYLFGSILAVQTSDVWLVAIVAATTLLLLPMWGRWAYASFDRDLAQAGRVPVQRDDLLLSVLLAVTIVASVKIAGIILIAAFLVIPAATARLLASRFRTMTAVSVGIGSLTAAIGLVLSYVLDVPSGATIVLVQAMLFFGAFIANR